MKTGAKEKHLHWLHACPITCVISGKHLNLRLHFFICTLEIVLLTWEGQGGQR